MDNGQMYPVQSDSAVGVEKLRLCCKLILPSTNIYLREPLETFCEYK